MGRLKETLIKELKNQVEELKIQKDLDTQFFNFLYNELEFLKEFNIQIEKCRYGLVLIKENDKNNNIEELIKRKKAIKICRDLSASTVSKNYNVEYYDDENIKRCDNLDENKLIFKIINFCNLAELVEEKRGDIVIWN